MPPFSTFPLLVQVAIALSMLAVFSVAWDFLIFVIFRYTKPGAISPAAILASLLTTTALLVLWSLA